MGWVLAIAAVAFIIADNCGFGMLETMYLQADLLVNTEVGQDGFNELTASLGAEWDACTVIIDGKLMD